jgi:hypothetical protein
VFDGFSFEKYTLNISLSTTEGFDKIAAFNSDDEEFASTSVTASAGQVSLDFSGYTPGEHRFAAINSDDGSVVSETTESLEPNLELVNWQTASEAGMYSPDDDSAVTDVVLSVENTGNAPDKLTWVGYRSEQFMPEWSEDGETEPTQIDGRGSPEAQMQHMEKHGIPDPLPEFKSGKEVPIPIFPGEKMQLVDATNNRYLLCNMEQDSSIVQHEDTKGWSVQEGVEYNFTVAIGTEHSGSPSMKKEVTWEEMGTAESMTNQPADALISTEKVEGSS